MPLSSEKIFRSRKTSLAEEHLLIRQISSIELKRVVIENLLSRYDNNDKINRGNVESTIQHFRMLQRIISDCTLFDEDIAIAKELPVGFSYLENYPNNKDKFNNYIIEIIKAYDIEKVARMIKLIALKDDYSEVIKGIYKNETTIRQNVLKKSFPEIDFKS